MDAWAKGKTLQCAMSNGQRIRAHLACLLKRCQLHRLERHDFPRLTVARLINLVESSAPHKPEVLVAIDGLRAWTQSPSDRMGA